MQAKRSQNILEKYSKFWSNSAMLELFNPIPIACKKSIYFVNSKNFKADTQMQVRK